MDAKIIAISISRAKGQKKTNIPEAELVVNHGIEGDAHAGPWHRQLSLLGIESIELMRKSGADVNPGDFAENIAKTETYLARLKGDLEKLAGLIQSESALNGQLSLEDIIVFPVLRNLTCVKDIEFPPAVLAYITNMAKLSDVPLYFDKAV